MPHQATAVARPARRVQVPAAADGQRLDNFLLGELALPRTRIYRLIRKGEVRVNRGRAQPSTRLAAGDEVRIPPLREAPPGAPAAVPEGLCATLRAALLLEAPGLRIIDKPAGWASQPGSGVQTSLVEIARATLGEGWQPAHRLDRDTSGCLALVEGRPAMQAFTAGDWDKAYLALAHGAWIGPTEQRWEDRLERRADGQVVAAQGDGGKFAAMQVRCLGSAGGASLLRCVLETGRTHQIRVQAALRGMPLLGDRRYGQRDRDAALGLAQRPGLTLHAWELAGPWQGERLHARAPLPAQWAPLLDALELEAPA